MSFLALSDVRDRLVRSLEALRAFIFDSRVIDPSLVESLLVNSGVISLLGKSTMGSIVVYYIDSNKFRRKCLYEKCSTIDNVIARESCLRECISTMERDVLKAIVEALTMVT